MNGIVRSIGATALGLATMTAVLAARNDTVVDNLVTHQGGGGIVVNDYPDPAPATVPTYCHGGIPGVPNPLGPGTVCYFVAYGNRVLDNDLAGNGFFGNPTNGDLADATVPFPVDNCFRHNDDLRTDSPSSDPPHIQNLSVLGRCGVAGAGDTGMLFAQLACAAFHLCPAGGAYPQPTEVRLLPIPDSLESMPQPCEGVPANPFCDA